MTVYRVTLRGEGIRVTFEGTETPCGFYKNEFVWAKNSEQAIDRARANAAAALRRNAAVNKADLPGLSLKVDGIQAGLRLQNLLQR